MRENSGSLLTRQLCCSTEIARQTPRTQTIVRTGSRYPLAVFRGSFCGNQKGERTMLLSRGYLTVQCVMHGAPAPTGVLPSELPVNTCFDELDVQTSLVEAA